MAFLDLDVCESCVFAEQRPPRAHRTRLAGEKQVDAFFGQQHRALEPARRSGLVQPFTQRRQVGQGDKTVGGDVETGHCAYGMSLASSSSIAR